MSVEHGGWPTSVELFPRLTRVARGITHIIRQLPTEGYPSSHAHYEHGAAAMLDRALDNQPQLPLEPSDGEAIPAPQFGWDSEGNYFEDGGAL